MDERVVTASELARNTSSLLDEVDQGRTVVIERRGRPVALLIPRCPAGASQIGRLVERGRQVVDDEALLAPVEGWSMQ